jgi:hypothetical protein
MCLSTIVFIPFALAFERFIRPRGRECFASANHSVSDLMASVGGRYERQRHYRRWRVLEGGIETCKKYSNFEFFLTQWGWCPGTCLIVYYRVCGDGPGWGERCVIVTEGGRGNRGSEVMRQLILRGNGEDRTLWVLFCVGVDREMRTCWIRTYGGDKSGSVEEGVVW